MAGRGIPEPDDAGGDPACLLHRACPECGLFLEDPDDPCPRCARTDDPGRIDPLPSRP